MALASGTRLGAYEIVALLGAGGMGEVYRATDTKLGRGVALKVLPEALAADPDRIARFEREAKVLAPLAHANIAALYGMEQHDSRHCLVMELVEGETLADRLQRGPLKTADALGIARQICEALEAAHEKGVVHRDLKPANVKITPDGAVKVLDFGLAKALETGAGSREAGGGAANSPTLSMMATQAGIVLGTAAYMSPEQAKGAPADQRSDVFSFGVVIYEMLTCRTPFPGDTAPEIMASVLVREPDLTALPPALHPRLRDLITRCLEKSPRKRWQAVGDLRVEIEGIAAAPHTTAVHGLQAPARPFWKRGLALVGAAAAGAAVATAIAAYIFQSEPAQVSRFTVLLPEKRLFGGTGRTFVAISPDGAQLAYVVDGNRLIVRPLNALQANPVGGLDDVPAVQPAFSPDGKWLAFWATQDGTLKKVAVDGGPPVTLCKTLNPFGISWDRGFIAFAGPNGVMRVPDGGGEPEMVAEVSAGWAAGSPQLIDNGRAVLFAMTETVFDDRWDRADIVYQRLGSTERTTVLQGGSEPRYLSSGHLLFMKGGTLMAVGFDAATGRTTGTPVSAVEGILRATMVGSGSGQFVVSTNGTLAFVSGTNVFAGRRSVTRLSLDGRREQLSLPPNAYETPRVSPDGRFLAVATADNQQSAIWIHDMSGTGPPRRLTFGGKNLSPLWTPDGRSIVFQSTREGDAGLFVQRADGSGGAERLTTADKNSTHWPSSWTPDGRTLAYMVTTSSGTSLWTVSTTGDRTPVRLDVSPGRPQVTPAFSPDGRWLAYASTEPGGPAYLVFVVPYPLTGAKYQLTTSATSTPAWSRDGRRLFFAFGDNVSVIDVRATTPFTFGRPTLVPTAGTLPSSPTVQNYDISPDAQHVFVVTADSDTQTSDGPTAPHINVVLNWVEELKARVR